jgi:hypothetical protein
MKITAYRSTLPFDNRGSDGIASISPSTQKGIMPFLNVPTIQDIVENKISLKNYNPHSGGSWAPGDDVDKSYRENADDYKRQERDLDILRFMSEPSQKAPQKWTVKLPGGSKTFMSFELARQYTREKGLPFSYVRRVAQNTVANPPEPEQRRIEVIADALDRTLMVESLNLTQATRETGSAFCVAPNYFLTCAHVIKSYNKNVKTQENYFSGTMINMIYGDQKTEAHIVAVDPKLDLALLTSHLDVDFLRFDLFSEIGCDIIAIGSPHGYENNVSTGIVGSLNRKVYFYDGAPEYMFVDLSVFPGNSGGPVIKIDSGKIVGMITLIVSDVGGYGLNAALPSSYMVDFCKTHIKGFVQ